MWLRNLLILPFGYKKPIIIIGNFKREWKEERGFRLGVEQINRHCVVPRCI